MRPQLTDVQDCLRSHVGLRLLDDEKLTSCSIGCLFTTAQDSKHSLVKVPRNSTYCFTAPPTRKRLFSDSEHRYVGGCQPKLRILQNSVKRWHQDLKSERLFEKFGARMQNLVMFQESSGVSGHILRSAFLDARRQSAILCSLDRTSLGADRWYFQNVSAKRLNSITLLCLCDPTNRKVDHSYLVPNLSAIPMGALLKENDPGMTNGKRLEMLSALKNIAQSFRT
jgi:hypothetical protein